MKFYEYQAKAVFERFGIPKPAGQAIHNLTSLSKALKELGKGPWAVKAQIQAGGRGKAGGVQLVATPAEAKQVAKRLLSKLQETTPA